MDWTIEVVVIPISDADRAKAFYTEQCGFNVDVDHRASEHFREVQVTPPGSACSITFGVGLNAMEPGSMKGLQLVVPDIEAARAQLAECGVEVDEVVHFENGVMTPGRVEEDYGSFIFFSDPDGNAWAVQEVPSRRQG